jgi:hypothetical protein
MAAIRNYKTVIFKSSGTGTGRQIACPFADKTIPNKGLTRRTKTGNYNCGI